MRILLSFLLLIPIFWQSLTASPVQEITLNTGSSFEKPIRYFKNRTLRFSPPADGNLYQIEIKQTRSASGNTNYNFSLHQLSDDHMDERLSDEVAKSQRLSSGKSGTIHFCRKNLSLSGDAETCHLHATSINFEDILIQKKPSGTSFAESETKNLSFNFNETLLRLKLVPVNSENPYWISGKAQPEDTVITYKQVTRMGGHRTSPLITETLKTLSFRRPFNIIGASIEICCVTDLPA